MTGSGWPFGPYPEGGLERLGPHVTAYYADAMPISNSAIVRGTEATLVFDANVLRFARTLRAAVESGEGPPLRDLVLSHVHSDHAHGAMHFVPPARTWARSFTRDRLAFWAGRDLEPHIEEYRAYDPAYEAEYRVVRVVVPEMVVDERTVIELGGGVRVHLRPEATAHTPGDLWAFVEPDGVALCGDLWFNDCEPYLGHGSLAGSLAAIAQLREAGAAVYLPGHGRAGRIGPPGQEMMERLCAWLREQIAARLAQGLTGAALRSAIRADYEAQRDDDGGIRFAVAFPGFLEDAVEMAEEELAAPAG